MIEHDLRQIIDEELERSRQSMETMWAGLKEKSDVRVAALQLALAETRAAGLSEVVELLEALIREQVMEMERLRLMTLPPPPGGRGFFGRG